MTPQRRVRIFLAEDNDGDVFLVRLALERRGLAHDLVVARNGEAALALLDEVVHGPSSEVPELILLDLNLPKVNGSQILSYLRQIPAFLDIPVIVLTSSDSPKDRDAALSLGANLYFRKPTDLRAFMQLGQVIDETLHSPHAPYEH